MKYSGIGGQAVMEGVMMKNEDRYAVAVRKPDGTIETKVEDLRRARVLNFEMETSCLFTLCGLYGLRGGSVCTAFANRNKDKFAYGGIERSIQVANLAVQILHDWDQKMEAAGKKYWYPGLLK